MNAAGIVAVGGYTEYGRELEDECGRSRRCPANKDVT